jgi:arylsulfatase A-like enzyme
MIASDADKAAFTSLDHESQNHYGELVAMDRSIGTLRRGLREMALAENTLVWFCSDNGGLPNLKPGTVGDFRGFKNTVYEGGLRVPAIVEWPAMIKTPRITRHPAGTIDIFPTIADLLQLPATAMLKPVDGVSLKPLFAAEVAERAKPLPFRHQGRAALVDNRYKLVTQNIAAGKFELYDLVNDPKESKDVAAEQPEIATRMQQSLLAGTSR